MQSSQRPQLDRPSHSVPRRSISDLLAATPIEHGLAASLLLSAMLFRLLGLA